MSLGRSKNLKFNNRKTTTHIVIHSSATKPSMDWGVRDIDALHRSIGYLGVGYHVIIKRDGSTEEGRPKEALGAHVRGHNNTSLGICLIGGVDDNLKAANNFTTEQFHSLDVVLQGLENLYPNATIRGHGEMTGAKTECPSFDVQDWLNNKRRGS